MALQPKSGAVRALRNQRALPSAADLLERGGRRFLAGERLSIEELARELGVSRATAYRWVGNNDEFVGRVIAALAERTFRRALGEVRGRGAERVLEVMLRGMRYVLGSKAYRAFLHRDPERALRVVASKEGPAQRSTIELHQQLLEDEIRKGNLRLPVDAHTMAYALVRIAESFLYADLIAGEEPDLEKAAAILKLMLAERIR